jgi:uncharacterized DUF497 family protein
MSLVFEWDERKARSNRKKHRVTFTEAASVFLNPLAKIFEDEAHSNEELREIIVGHSSADRLMVVIFTATGRNRIRIISARCATKRERETTMKAHAKGTVKSGSRNEVLREYRLDYTQAKPNRFAHGSPSAVPAGPHNSAKSLPPDQAQVAAIMEALKSSLAAAPKPAPRRAVTVLLDPDVARVFKTPETVNAVLRAILTTIPPRRRSSNSHLKPQTSE